MSATEHVAFIEKVIHNCKNIDNHECVETWLESLVRSQQLSVEKFEELKKINEKLAEEK